MIAVDWGTTHLRAYRLGPDGKIESSRAEPRGIMTIIDGAFAAALGEVLGDWPIGDREQIVMSGMIGSRQGWAEVAYVACPAQLSDLARGLRAVAWGAGREAHICPGLSCRDIDGVPDVMRGEEVQIFGAMSLPGSTGATAICLPGTHSKHARIEGDAVTSFTTYMTGEVFGILRRYSILGRMMEDGPADLDAFDEGVRRAGQNGGLLHHIFGVRTRSLVGDMGAHRAGDYLSGILIGHEIDAAGMTGPVLIVGAPQLAALYGRALAMRSIESTEIAADVATVRGLHLLAGLARGGDA